MTIKDIARISGYGVSTVSRALNGHPDVNPETRKNIEDIVRQYKFVPNSNARQLKQTASTNILVVVNGTSNMFFAQVVEWIQFAMDKNKLTAIFHYIDERADIVKTAQRLISEQKPLGVIFLGGNIKRFEKGFSAITIPCVLCTANAGRLNFENLSSVCVDDEHAGREAIEYLYSLGHRRIGFIGGSDVGAYASISRLSGSTAVMKRHGLSYDDRYFVESRFSLESAYEATKELISRKLDITAIFLMSDIMAIGACRAINDMGLSIPDDISIIGFDGIMLADYLRPRLSTFRQPADKLAAKSVDLLIAQMKGEPARHILLKAELIEGESVKRRDE